MSKTAKQKNQTVSLSDVIGHFGMGNFQRAILAQRLDRIYNHDT